MRQDNNTTKDSEYDNVFMLSVTQLKFDIII